MTHRRTTSNRARIKIAAHVVIQLGQELVTDVEQAFLELAKNAYDADAETCNITIDPDWPLPQNNELYELISAGVVARAPKDARGNPKVGRALINDTGIGATVDGVLDGWLTISASLKRAKRGSKVLTEKYRTPVGDKGLGRLATMKIGDLLLFRTAQEGERFERVTCFSWGEFERVKTIDQVTVDQWEVARSYPYGKGSTVEIVGLHDRARWTPDGVNKLVARLSGLVNPYVDFDDFDIEISRPGKQALALKKIGSDILNFSSAKFTFEWDGQTLVKKAFISRSLFRGTTGDKDKERFDLAFSEMNIGKFRERIRTNKTLGKRGPELQHPGKGWFAKFEELDERKTVQQERATSKSSCGAFAGEIHYFMFNEEFHNKVHGSSSSVSQVQEMAGVMIFRDGFRVRADDDWLNLSEGTTSGSFYNLRPKNTLGYFAVSNKNNPNLVEKSDREGFIENDALKEFIRITGDCRDYANTIIKACREEYNAFQIALAVDVPGVATPRQARIKLDSTRKKTVSQLIKVQTQAARAMERIVRVKTALDTGGGKAEAAREIEGMLKGFSSIESGVAEIKLRVSELDRTSDAIEGFRQAESDRNVRLLEAASVGLSARVLAHEARTFLDLIDGAITTLTVPVKRFGDATVSQALRDLALNVREIRKLIGSINPLLPGSRTVKEQLSLGGAIANYLKERASSINARGITLRVMDSDNETIFRFSKVRFHQILENLLQNSLYWLEHSDGSSARREIHVMVRNDGFQWWDTGPGIPERHENDLFEAYVSSKPSTEGQGLGLYIISTYLETERCDISLLLDRNSLGRRFKFQIDLSGVIVGSS